MLFIRVIVLGAVIAISGCAKTMALRAPIPVHEMQAKTASELTVVIPSETAAFVYSKNSHGQTLSFPFGTVMSPSITRALNGGFEKVTVVSESPELPSDHAVLSVAFAEVDVEPGAMTFSSSSARVALAVEIALPNGQTHATEVTGEAEKSPGALGSVLVGGLNFTAYDNALLAACEYALASAIDQAAEFARQHADAP